MGMGYEIVTAAPGRFFSNLSNRFAVPFFAMSLSLNVILTILIVGRMWFHQRESRKVLGPKYGQHYSFISGMFVESAALYSINSILLLGTYISGNALNQIWLGLAPSVQASSLLYS